MQQTANQFFSTWGAFYTSVYLLARWFAASITTSDLILLCATSGSVFGASDALRNNQSTSGSRDFTYQCEISTEYSCDRVDGARILGAVSLTIALAMGVLSLIPRGKFLFIPNIVVGTILVIGWCVGIGEIFFWQLMCKLWATFSSHFVLFFVEYPGYIVFGSGPGTSGKILSSVYRVFFGFVTSLTPFLSRGQKLG